MVYILYAEWMIWITNKHQLAILVDVHSDILTFGIYSPWINTLGPHRTTTQGNMIYPTAHTAPHLITTQDRSWPKPLHTHTGECTHNIPQSFYYKSLN